ncbi:hypothetical protein D3OALGA1CA_3310 [Olavius algarvensis associated proteobacterium Delta 3]|nr:hypothetical protein D3OALGA1CA_3310 [Olavius algarvensis associated proteobacterium Delta 3]
MLQGRCGARPYVAPELCSVGRGTAPAQLRITLKRIESEQNIDNLYSIAEGCGRRTTDYYIRMRCISYGSVCELETRIFLAGDLTLVEGDALAAIKTDIAAIKRMLKALIKSLENKPRSPLAPPQVYAPQAYG